MKPIINIGKDFDIYNDVKPELAWALGAGETSLIRLSAAYSMMINGGKHVTPSILDRVQDGSGKTVYLDNDIACEYCQQDEYNGGPPPQLPDNRDQIIDPVTAYQVTYMMQGVVDNGTGFRLRALDRPLGGKTGTTNDSLDAWFMGFSPDLVVGVYIGMDTPEQMGNETGSSAAAPVVTDFMREVLADIPKVPFRIPEGVTLAPINRTTGEPSYIGAPDFILEAFRPGTEPSLGGLSNTIRVGSGSDVFGSYGARGAQDNGAFDEFNYDNDFATPEAELGPKDTKELNLKTPAKRQADSQALLRGGGDQANLITGNQTLKDAAAKNPSPQALGSTGLNGDAEQGLKAAEDALKGLSGPRARGGDTLPPKPAIRRQPELDVETPKPALTIPKSPQGDLDDGLY